MRERDPTQRAIDVAVIAEAADKAKAERRELAVAINNAVVRAFSAPQN